MRRLWYLNLDAEEELAAGPGWQPRPALRRALEGPCRQAAARLLAPGDLLLRPALHPGGPFVEGDGEGAAAGGEEWRGLAWCMTPHAQGVLRGAGVEPEPAPPLEVLRRVNDRRFLLEQGLAAEGSRRLDDGSDWRRLRDEPGRGVWRLKRPLGAAGRGQRLLAPGPPSRADEAWVHASLRRGGLVAEPELELELECVTHGWIEADGRIWVGPTRRQVVDGRGAWVSTGRRLTGLRAPAEGAWRAGRALVQAGYFGPFGVDSRMDRRGHWHPCGDLNARYTMGWRSPRLVVAPGPP